MKNHQIVLLPGDGIGQEITTVASKVLDRVSKKFNFRLEIKEHLIGGSAIQETGDPLPKETLSACKESDAVLLAAIGSPEFDNLPREKRPESGLLKLRSGMHLFANIRPVKVFPALLEASTLKPEIIEDVDLVVVRELTGGVYFGKPKGRIKSEDSERAFNTMTYSAEEIKRISQVAFEIAKERRKKVCSVDKANVLDVSQLWRDKVEEISVIYKDINLSHQYVDNAAMQLIRNPKQFDVLLTGNLFGDILSDEAAMLTGSIGMLPSASLGKEGTPGLFEPVHGSAPDIAGLNMANPIAMALSAAMMLRIGLKEHAGAEAIENSINTVLDKGFRTADLMSKGCTELGCREMGERIIEEI